MITINDDGNQYWNDHKYDNDYKDNTETDEKIAIISSRHSTYQKQTKKKTHTQHKKE